MIPSTNVAALTTTQQGGGGAFGDGLWSFLKSAATAPAAFAQFVGLLVKVSHASSMALNAAGQQMLDAGQAKLKQQAREALIAYAKNNRETLRRYISMIPHAATKSALSDVLEKIATYGNVDGALANASTHLSTLMDAGVGNVNAKLTGFLESVRIFLYLIERKNHSSQTCMSPTIINYSLQLQWICGF